MLVLGSQEQPFLVHCMSRFPVEADTLQGHSLGTDIASGWHKWKAFQVKLMMGSYYLVEGGEEIEGGGGNLLARP